MTTQKPKIIALVGPTASGKSEKAVTLAKQHNGEILSIDSRQIYRGMDIGTGKVKGAWRIRHGKKVFMYKAVPHYGIDIANPKRQYSISQFQKYARSVITDMLRRGKTPILCGGTAHWMDAVVYNQQLPAVKPNAALRRQLQQYSTGELFRQLEKADPRRAATIDPHNPRRLIRALEIVSATGKTIPRVKAKPLYAVEWVGIKPDPELLREKISRRLHQRVKQGMFEEIQNLHRQGISWKKLWEFGLEYRYGSLFLQGKMNKEETVAKLITAINQYAKRQLTWWKRNKQIKWES